MVGLNIKIEMRGRRKDFIFSPEDGAKKKQKEYRFLNVSFHSVNYPAAELRGIKIQNLFPCCHSCGSRNPVFPSFSGLPLSRE
jgi:hypothetical protein